MKASTYMLLNLTTSYVLIVLVIGCTDSQQDGSLKDSSSLLRGDVAQELTFDPSPNPAPKEMPELTKKFEIPSDWSVRQSGRSNCDPDHLSSSLAEHFTMSIMIDDYTNNYIFGRESLITRSCAAQDGGIAQTGQLIENGT